MEFETFTWCPLIETPSKVEFKKMSVQFGDGYKQTVSLGINNRSESWTLTFRNRQNVIHEIKAFLDDKQGHIPFYWTPLRGVPTLYECEDYNIANISDNGVNDGAWSLTAVFNQRFDL